MTVVSRWLVMPMAAMSAAERLALRIASCATASWVVQISSGSCSTQPDWGKIWRNSFCATAWMWPSRLKRMARELVVPWSRARMKDTHTSVIRFAFAEELRGGDYNVRGLGRQKSEDATRRRGERGDRRR